jgi:hypothetical protein
MDGLLRVGAASLGTVWDEWVRVRVKISYNLRKDGQDMVVHGGVVEARGRVLYERATGKAGKVERETESSSLEPADRHLNKLARPVLSAIWTARCWFGMHRLHSHPCAPTSGVCPTAHLQTQEY